MWEYDIQQYQFVEVSQQDWITSNTIQEQWDQQPHISLQINEQRLK